MKDILCPTFDQAFPTLIEDLDSRGLLSETLVLAMGEFGRSPKINPNGGRDHWGDCFSIAMAGAGIGRGLVIGASDNRAAYPVERRVTPADLAATIYHLLGIDTMGELTDRLGRPQPLVQAGTVIKELFA